MARLLAITCALALASTANADLIELRHRRSIDSIVRSVMRCRHFSAMSVAIVRGNDTYAQGYGFADMQKRNDADKDTTFCVASCSKAFSNSSDRAKHQRTHIEQVLVVAEAWPCG